MKSLSSLLLKYLDGARTWLRASPVRLVLAFSVAFALYFLLVHVGPLNLTLSLPTLRAAAAAIVFGIFLGIIFVSKQMRSPLEATLVRVFAGIIAGPVITLIFSSSLLVLLGAGFVGALLGYFGPSCADHV